MRDGSYLETEFLVWLRHEKLPTPLREHRFAAPRRWRFDFAWPDVLVAVEVEGGVWSQGRHQRAAGFVADCEKYESALRLGWRVYRVPGVWIVEGARRVWRPEVIETLRILLNVSEPQP